MKQHRPYSIIILQYTIIFLAVYQTLQVIDHIQGAFNESDTIIHAWINGILIVSSFTIWIAFCRSKLGKEMKRDFIKMKL